MIKHKLTCILLLYATFAAAQEYKGRVLDASNGQALPGAQVHWAGTPIGTATDNKGFFSIKAAETPSGILVASMVGYAPDSSAVQSQATNIVFRLEPSATVPTVEIAEKQAVFSHSTTGAINTEAMNRGILRKAACCNISETFDATTTVDVVLNDALTGARKIQMLGLEGVYVQNLFEGIPFTRGLGNLLGFDQIPGPWVNAIHLSKGIGSAVHGYESMTGQINLDFLQPCDLESIHFDIFGSNQGRIESNLIMNRHLGNDWSTSLFVGGHFQEMRVDNNRDGFLDMPLREGVKLMNRWKHEGDKVRTQFIARYTFEDRMSGEVDFNRADDRGKADRYGFGLSYHQVEAMAKVGIFSDSRDDRSLGLTALYSYTDADAYFGLTEYRGSQHSARFNSIFETKFAEASDHSIKTGLHFLYDKFDERLTDSTFARVEQVPGIFAEYTWERPRFTLLAGNRVDFHNMFGTQLSPRLHLKYNLKPLSTVRAVVGRGFRTPNVYADQIGLLASSRAIRVESAPKAESSWNTGISILHKFTLFGREAVAIADYFYTTFENQLVVDRDLDAQRLVFYNLEGSSTAHSLQYDLQAEPLRGFGTKFSYKYQFVETDYQTGRLEKPMIPRHRALANFSYVTAKEDWYFDLTGNYFGAMRLPSTQNNPEGFRLPEKSVSFVLVNAQITRVWNKIEVYAGVENIGNFIQSNAILDPENPFGTYFDASMIYGPLNGRMYYAGARMKLNTPRK